MSSPQPSKAVNQIDNANENEAPAGNDKDKGKGPTDTMVDRITKSGRNLLGNLMNSSSETPLMVTTSDKGQQGFSSLAGSSSQAGGPSSSHDSARFTSQRVGAGIRSTPVDVEASHGFSDFASDSIPSLTPGLLPDPHLSGDAVLRQEASDGAAVAALLSAPDDEEDFHAPEHEETGYLSPAAAESLSRALFGGHSTQLPWDRLLNLEPVFVTPAAETAFRENPGVVAEELTGVADIPEARSLWLEQWSEVLSSYTDHVWGDLAPLVAQAKQETSEQPAADQRHSETKALDRLRLILTHLRQEHCPQ